jgi:probable rRNA maturation factor
MPVRVAVHGGPYPDLSQRDIGARARAMLAFVQMTDAELSIVLTNDDQMQKLNRIYRRKNRPTDVLAFPQREGLHGELAGRLLGDVVVSVPTARRQALARGVSLRAEVTMLLAHGLLHLLGWDHETLAADRRMRKETARLCQAAEGAGGRGAALKGKTERRSNPGSTPRSGSRNVR